MRTLAGLYAALPTAFTAEFDYDGDAQKSLATHAISLGLDGLFVGGSTAEVHNLTLAERVAALRDVADAASDATKLVAHVGAMREEDTLKLCEEASQSGYHAVASTPPFYSPYSRSDRQAFFDRLIRHAKLPVFLYHIPSLTGLDLDHGELLSLLAMDGIVGMKLSANDLMLVQEAKAQMPDKLILFGSDELLGLALCAGADGGVGSTYNLFGRSIVALRDAVGRHDLDAMRSTQAQVNRGIAALVEAGVFQGLKIGLKKMGAPCGPTRPPLQMPDTAATSALLAKLEGLLH